MKEHTFFTRRVLVEKPPGPGPGAEDVLETAHRAFGAQWEWAWGLPGVFQALASPTCGAPVPAPPDRARVHEQVRGYWFPLFYLLAYRLGWDNMGAGLRWWYDKGRPLADPTLALIDHVWGADGQLDKAVAWASLRPVDPYEGTMRFDVGPFSPEWHRWLEQHRSHKAGGFDLETVSGDNLHLSTHLRQVPDTLPGAVVRLPGTSPLAVGVFESASDWYPRLHELGSRLEPLGNTSWHVDVYVKSIGFMGTFRRSRVTGRWFCGQHHVHAAGSRDV